MGKAKKSTIKFQKKHLKETIERRRQHSKVKKKIAQRKERQKLRETQIGDSEKNKNNDNKKNKDEEESSQTQVNVSDFFCSFAIDPEESLDLSDDEEGDLDALDQFDAPDPEELEAEGALEENEDDAMEEDSADDEIEEDDSHDEEFMSEDEEEEEEDKEDHSDATAVTKEMLQEWSEAARKKQPSALKELLKAFRSIARSDEEDTQCTYYVNNHKVYTSLVKVTIKSAYPIFSDHIVTSKKVRHPAKTKNWQKLEKVVRLYLNNCVRFLRDLQQSDLVTYTLTHLEPCSIYFGCFPKAAREYLRVLLDRWSDMTLSSDARAQCHSALRRFATDAVDVQKRSYLAHTLKGVYMTFAKKVTKVTESNLSLIEQMMQEAADIYTIEPKGSFQHSDVYIRQLSNHMKTAKKTKTVEAFKEIYNWQFISCLDFWAAVVGATCSPETGANSPMQNVVKPLVDLCLSTMRLNPTAQFVPLRVHIVRTLINLIDATGFYIPLGPFTLELFDSQTLRAPAEDSDLEEFNWQVYLKTPSEYTPTKVYRDAMFQAYYDNVVDFYGCFGLSIAFPELVIPVLSKLKEESKRLKNTRFFKPLKTLIEKLEMHKNYIEQKRAPIEYSATKLVQVHAFLRNTSFETTPLGGFIANRNSR